MSIGSGSSIPAGTGDRDVRRHVARAAEAADRPVCLDRQAAADREADRSSRGSRSRPPGTRPPAGTHVHATPLATAGKVKVTSAPVAANGPAFVTPIVQRDRLALGGGRPAREAHREVRRRPPLDRPRVAARPVGSRVPALVGGRAAGTRSRRRRSPGCRRAARPSAVPLRSRRAARAAAANVTPAAQRRSLPSVGLSVGHCRLKPPSASVVEQFFWMFQGLPPFAAVLSATIEAAQRRWAPADDAAAHPVGVVADDRHVGEGRRVAVVPDRPPRPVGPGARPDAGRAVAGERRVRDRDRRLAGVGLALPDALLPGPPPCCRRTCCRRS